MKRLDTIFVRNNDSEPFADRYDGEDFVIGPGEALEIEADAAKLTPAWAQIEFREYAIEFFKPYCEEHGLKMILTDIGPSDPRWGRP